MAADERYGELFEGEEATKLGLMRKGHQIAFTVIVADDINGGRVRVPVDHARAAWWHLGELLGMAELVERRARDLAREWIRMDENAKAELDRLREELAELRGKRVDAGGQERE